MAEEQDNGEAYVKDEEVCGTHAVVTDGPFANGFDRLERTLLFYLTDGVGNASLGSVWGVLLWLGHRHRDSLAREQYFICFSEKHMNLEALASLHAH